MFEFIEKLQDAKGTNEKLVILYSISECDKELLVYTYDKIKYQYNITKKRINLSKGNDIFNQLDWKHTKKYLEELHLKELTGNHAKELMSYHISRYSERYQKILLSIINRSLDIGISKTGINKVFPDLISDFKVTLAKKFDIVNAKKLPFNNNWVSRKMDGVRCIAIKDNSGLRFMSRQGKVFETLATLKDKLDKFMPYNTVFDGEIVLYTDTEDKTEDFQEVMKKIRKKDYDMKDAVYTIFDMMSIDDFHGNGTKLFKHRYSYLSEWFEFIKPHEENISVLEQNYIATLPQLREIFESIPGTWEGLIIRDANSVYEPKRTSKLLKIKSMHDEEYIVTNFFEGDGKYHGTLGAMEVALDKDNRVLVGSGFSDELRNEIWRNRNIYLNMTATIQYFEKTTNEKGGKSLRFPVFKSFR